MLVDVIIYKIHEWIHFLWKLWRPSEDTFFAQIIDYFKFDVNWFPSCVGLESWFLNFISICEKKKKKKWKFKENIFALVSHMKKTHSQ